jgi:dipeptidyl aminopeptidase/acylaminoacyl peptidase
MRRALLLLAASAALLSAQKQPFDADSLMRLARIGEPRLSPDGRNVAFSVQYVDVAGNTRPRQIYVVPTGGGTPIRLTHQGDANERPRWSPDSKQIAFVSSRSGSSQIWIMEADGSGARQATDFAAEASGVLFSPDGKHLLFTSEVYPECGANDDCNRRRIEEERDSKVKARIYTGLLYRHWNRWQTPRRKHLMIVPAGGGEPRDLTPGDRDVPPFSLGGADDYAVSPDGAEVCFAMKTDPVAAVSTNTDLFVVPVEGGEARRITTNPGADHAPLYSPDGRWMAWLTQARAGYESDRWRLVVLERATGRPIDLTGHIDRWVTGFAWSPDSSRIFFTTEDRGRQAIQFVSVTGGEIRVAAGGESSLSEMQFTPDGKTMIYAGQSGSQPMEIYRASSAGGSAVPLTRLNEPVLSSRQATPYEEFWVEGAENTQVHSFLVKPYGFRADRRYPVLMLIHGGPQGAWGQAWNYRWNAQVFAAAGYVVVLPNPRGSTGYGQKFIDEINDDWGGRVFDDLMAVTDHLVTLPYVDASRMAAAGGSFGGYMVNWILGRTARFKALVSHAGVYELNSMFGETEELWFPLWEFGGTPWDNPESYSRWSPANFAKEFRTPTLVIHGELDYRVPYGQGLQLYTALQLQKAPSKLLLFPDEGHWILKPQNSLLWYKTFIDWIDTWTKKRE